MQSLRWFMVVLVLVGPAAADPCGPGAEVEYPLSAVLRDEALGYLVEAITDKDVPPDPDPLLPYGSAYRLVWPRRRRRCPTAWRTCPISSC